MQQNTENNAQTNIQQKHIKRKVYKQIKETAAVQGMKWRQIYIGKYSSEQELSCCYEYMTQCLQITLRTVQLQHQYPGTNGVNLQQITNKIQVIQQTLAHELKRIYYSYQTMVENYKQMWMHILDTLWNQYLETCFLFVDTIRNQTKQELSEHLQSLIEQQQTQQQQRQNKQGNKHIEQQSLMFSQSEDKQENQHGWQTKTAKSNRMKNRQKNQNKQKQSCQYHLGQLLNQEYVQQFKIRYQDFIQPIKSKLISHFQFIFQNKLYVIEDQSEHEPQASRLPQDKINQPRTNSSGHTNDKNITGKNGSKKEFRNMKIVII